MSHTVSAGIHTLVALDKLPPSARHTAEFVSDVNNIFDLLNIRSCATKSLASKDLATLVSYHDKVKQWQVGGRVQPCFTGLLLNITAVNLLSQSLFESGDFSYVLTGRLTQDCLENFFSQVRCRGGHRTNPSAKEFCYTFRSLCTNMLLAPVHSGNCTYANDDVLVSLSALSTTARKRKAGHHSDAPAEKVPRIDSHSPNDQDNLHIESLEDLQVDTVQANVVTYIAGFLLHKMKCQQCRQHLTCMDNVVQDSQVFLHFKVYDHTQSSPFGALTVPHLTLSELFCRVEKIFQANINRLLCASHILASLQSLVEKRAPLHMLDVCPAHNNLDVLKCLTMSYLRCRLFYFCKFETRKTADNRKLKRNKKAKILCHE